MITCVLLSTYNGEMFVKEQVNSIILQTKKPDYLIVRDDGSSDKTLKIIEDTCEGSGINLKIFTGPNMGPARSFMELMRLGLDTNSDIFFFCDQDDIWEKHKIAEFLPCFDDKSSEPLAVFSQLLLVDGANNSIMITKPPRKIGFGNALIENIMTGCALACNRALLLIASEHELKYPPMHDHFIYILATAFGKAHYIESPLTRYRQHGSNVVGYSTSTLMSLRGKVRRILKGKDHKKSDLASKLLLSFGSMPHASDTDTLSLISKCPNSFMARTKLVLSRRLWRQNRLHSIIWRTLCILGLF